MDYIFGDLCLIFKVTPVLVISNFDETIVSNLVAVA